MAASAELALEKQQLHEEMTVVSAGRAAARGQMMEQEYIQNTATVAALRNGGGEGQARGVRRTHASSGIPGHQHFLPASLQASPAPPGCCGPA